MIYKLILTLRNLRYRSGKHSVQAEVPTVCIGNITVGGTGKTPHTELTLSRLREVSRFCAPAVLSRGYKRRSRGFQQVMPDSTALFAGDEPLQVKRRFPDVTVAVCKDRIEGCGILVHPERAASLKKCVSPEFQPADVIVLDDAFQYRRLRCSLNVVLVDYARPVTKDSLLPGGRLRDLKSRLYDADVIIVSKCPYELTEEEKADYAALLGFGSYDPASCLAVRRGRSIPLLFSGLQYGRPEPVFPGADPRYTYSAKLVLLTGIADDTPLRSHLSDGHKIVGHLRYSDHHRYTRADSRTIASQMRRNPTAAFITTEKDAQRLRDLKKLPDGLAERLFYIPVTACFFSDAESEVFDQYLHRL
ncbi:MAG: tetraacyldisaccharide 4'-kinase [Bacteroidales bacterium]|nr:tetraacyldisaccharide 4'-kinase [Bacteroidales bacterium]